MEIPKVDQQWKSQEVLFLESLGFYREVFKAVFKAVSTSQSVVRFSKRFSISYFKIKTHSDNDKTRLWAFIFKSALVSPTQNTACSFIPPKERNHFITCCFYFSERFGDPLLRLRTRAGACTSPPSLVPTLHRPLPECVFLSAVLFTPRVFPFGNFRNLKRGLKQTLDIEWAVFLLQKANPESSFERMLFGLLFSSRVCFQTLFEENETLHIFDRCTVQWCFCPMNATSRTLPALASLDMCLVRLPQFELLLAA